MKKTVLFLFLFYSCYGVAQKSKNSDASSLDLYYGYKPYFTNFQNQLNTTQNLELNKPLQIVGIGASGHFISMRNGDFDGHLKYSQVLPQTIHINDTIRSKLTGFVFGFAYGRAVTIGGGVFNLCYYLGVNAGRLRIYGNDLTRQKNGFFAPKIGIQPKLKLGKLAISCIVEADYDVTNPNWKRTWTSGKNQASVSKIRQSGIVAELGIGYIMD